MTLRSATLLTSLVCIAAAQAQIGSTGSDYSRFSAIYSGGMDVDGDNGELEVFTADIRSLLTDPITSVDNMVITPTIHYRATRLNFSDTATGFPIGDEDLHTISLSSSFLYNQKNCPWIYSVWTQAKMATDFQHVDGDDFTFDILGGIGYRFSERFTLGFGMIALNLNGDESIYPGISFDWQATDTLRVGLYGLNFITAYTPAEDWTFNFIVDSASEQWNIRSANGRSRNIDFTSYRAGFFVDRRLTDKIWLRAGTGMTFGNEIELESPSGRRDFKRDLDEGFFGEITLRVINW